MGLDMYVYHLHKPDKTSEELSRLADDCGGIDTDTIYTTFAEEYGLPPDFDNIREATVKFHFVCEEVDHEKLKKDFDIPQAARYDFRSANDPPEIGGQYTFLDDQGVDRSVKFAETVLQGYKYDKTCEAYAVIEKQLAYWRGHSYMDLLHSMYRASDMPVENCGYYPMNREMLKVVAKYDLEAYDAVARRFNGKNLIVFHYSW